MIVPSGTEILIGNKVYKQGDELPSTYKPKVRDSIYATDEKPVAKKQEDKNKDDKRK